MIADDYSPFAPMPGVPAGGARVIHGLDGGRLRLFFLSVLWRAAVSQLPEFKEVDVRASDIRRLRRMLLDQDPTPLSFFPVSLHQIVTRGAIHNHTPLAERRPIDLAKLSGATVPIFRFYFDGLVAHNVRPQGRRHVAGFTDCMLGGSGPLLVSTTDFGTSRQRETVAGVLAEAERRWPDKLARSEGFRGPRRSG